MKKLRLLSLLIIVAMLFALLAGCGNTENTAPEISGVGDIKCIVNTPVDLLATVAALDVEDGDITPQIEIDVFPYVQVTDGYATFTASGEYEVTYTVEDSAGESAEDIAYVMVYERETYVALLGTNGFNVTTGGSATVSANGITDGAYTFTVNGAQDATDAILSREYSLKPSTDYTVTYYANSNVAGQVTVMVGETTVKTATVVEGDNQINFTYTTPAAEQDEETVAVTFDLYLGTLGEEIVWKLSKVDTEYEQQGEGRDELLEGFNFNGKIYDRFDGTQGSIGTTDGGNAAYVEITQAGDGNWRGGVFINTGLQLSAGTTYYISFDLQSEQNTPFEVQIQRKQWGPDEFIKTIDNPVKNGHNEVTITDNTSGELWLYIQSGAHLNKITISNLSVQVDASGVKHESYTFDNVTASHSENGKGSVKVENGKIIYTAESFGNTDWHNKIESAPFRIENTGMEYVITFRAKASKPIKGVFAIYRNGTSNDILWTTFDIGTQETVYTFFATPSSSALYQMVWQLGASVNQKYQNVTIEISDIQICHKSVLDIKEK